MINQSTQTFVSDLAAVGIRDRLRRFITNELLFEQSLALNDDDDLLLSGLVDSLGVVRLVTFIETEFHVVVPPEDVVLENFQTLTAMSEYLQRKPQG
jgi:acyl carrier protein